MPLLMLALVQMRCEKAAIGGNLDEMRRYLEQARAAGAELACFPEMNITGYINPQQHPEAVIPIDGPAVGRVCEMSREYEMAIIAGLVEDNPSGRPFITQLVAQQGRMVAHYRKMTIKEDEAAWFSPGHEQPLFEIKGIKCGLAICADIDEPRIFKGLAQKGAELVIECAAPGLYGDPKTRDWQDGYDWWKDECFGKLRHYAADNGIHIAVATQAGRTVDEDFPGGGYLFSPQGRCLAQSPGWEEGLLLAGVPVP